MLGYIRYYWDDFKPSGFMDLVGLIKGFPGEGSKKTGEIDRDLYPVKDVEFGELHYVDVKGGRLIISAFDSCSVNFREYENSEDEEILGLDPSEVPIKDRDTDTFHHLNGITPHMFRKMFNHAYHKIDSILRFIGFPKVNWPKESGVYEIIQIEIFEKSHLLFGDIHDPKNDNSGHSTQLESLADTVGRGYVPICLNLNSEHEMKIPPLNGGWYVVTGMGVANVDAKRKRAVFYECDNIYNARLDSGYLGRIKNSQPKWEITLAQNG